MPPRRSGMHNEKNNTRMLDTLFIDDFIDILEQYFLY